MSLRKAQKDNIAAVVTGNKTVDLVSNRFPQLLWMFSYIPACCYTNWSIFSISQIFPTKTAYKNTLLNIGWCKTNCCSR